MRTLLFIGILVAPFSSFAPAGEPQKTVIPFDFVSQFDDGRYGQMVGDMIWKKLEREGGWVIPESMLDVRDTCQSQNIHPGPETPIEKMKQIMENTFGAEIAIWGGVERAPGADWEIYDLVIKCVDFSQYPEPKVIYEVKTRTNSVSEIPHLYVKQMLDALNGRQPGGPPPVDELAEKAWAENPNLVAGGDFEQAGVAGAPLGWESRGGQQREPLGNLVRWIPEVGNPGNKVIRFTFDAGVGDGFGVMYYSKPFPIQDGARYRASFRYRTNGPAVKVFIKCYDLMGSEYKGSDKYRPTTATTARGGAYVPEERELRECYRSQQNPKGAKNQWNTHVEEFTPKHTKYTPRYAKVMLYSYLGAGVVEFDDVVIKEIIPASPGDSLKEERHSLETRVTIKEMEENERRSREAKEQRRREQTGDE